MNGLAEFSGPAAVIELNRVFSLQRAAFARERYPNLRIRRDRLERLQSLARE